MTHKTGAPPCGIYIRINMADKSRPILKNVRQMAYVINQSSGYERNMNIVEITPDLSDEESREKTELLIKVAQNDGLAAVIKNDYVCAKKYGADGVLIDKESDYKAAREELGKKAIIGISSGSELKEIDYIILPSDPQIIARRSSEFDGAIVTSGLIDSNNCDILACAGATFIDATSYILNHEKGVMQATINMLDALERAAEIPVLH